MADTSRAATGSAIHEFEPDEASRLIGTRVQGEELLALMGRPSVARSFSDIDDPLEGCDSLCRTISYGRVGDLAGTHTRERNQAVTMRAFGYLPEWPSGWIGSQAWMRPDGDEEGRELDE